MLNHIVIMGRLTQDPELRHAGETPVCTFRIACDRDFADKNGNRETDFVDVVAWRKTGESVAKYFTKGRMAVVSGRLQIRPWQDKDGVKRYATEIVAEHVYFGDSKPDGKTRCLSNRRETAATLLRLTPARGPAGRGLCPRPLTGRGLSP